MSGVATAIVASAVVGGTLSANAQKKAAQTQADAAARAQGQLLATGEQAAQGYAPYTETGKTALSDITANKDYLTRQFGNQDLNAYLAPGYEFRLGQGQRANLQASNATGGMVGGNALRGLQDYTQNFASGEYANAFNQFQSQRTNIYNQLSDIAKMGLTAQQGSANALLGTGTNIASITSGLGNAQAASQIGQANAYGGAIQGAGNAAAYYAMNQNPNLATTNLSSLNYQYPQIGGTTSSYEGVGLNPTATNNIGFRT
jgi:hypothetical protein